MLSGNSNQRLSPSRHLDLMHFRYYFIAEDVEGVGIADVRHTDNAVIETQLREMAELVYGLLGRYAAVRTVAGDVDPVQAGLLDLLVWAVFGFAVPSQHVELVPQHFVAHPAKKLQASAYFATKRSVFCSPPPPIRMGGWGLVIAWGELSVCSRL